MATHKRKFRVVPIHTDRLLLRPVTMRDATDIFAYASDPEVTEYVRFVTHKSISETRAFIRRVLACYKKGTNPLWALELKSTGRMIGAMGFIEWPNIHQRAELGYVVNRDYWGQGLVTEAVSVLVEFAFHEMKLNRIEAGTIVEHRASQRVLEKCGFKLEGVLRQRELIKGRFPDVTMYSLLRKDLTGNAL